MAGTAFWHTEHPRVRRDSRGEIVRRVLAPLHGPVRRGTQECELSR